MKEMSLIEWAEKYGKQTAPRYLKETMKRIEDKNVTLVVLPKQRDAKNYSRKVFNGGALVVADGKSGFGIKPIKGCR